MINRNTNADRSTVISIVSLAAIVFAIAAIGSTGATTFADPVELENNTSVTAYGGNATVTLHADGTVSNSTPFDVRVEVRNDSGMVKNTTVSLNAGNVTDVTVIESDGISAGEKLYVSIYTNETHDEAFTYDIIGGSAGGGGGLLGGTGGLSAGALLALGAVAWLVMRDE